jgi:hypothetical protein
MNARRIALRSLGTGGYASADSAETTGVPRAMPAGSIIREDPMRCHRCGGIMVYEKFYGPHEQFFGWRCIFCGEIVDEVILENRFAQRIG